MSSVAISAYIFSKKQVTLLMMI